MEFSKESGIRGTIDFGCGFHWMAPCIKAGTGVGDGMGDTETADEGMFIWERVTGGNELVTGATGVGVIIIMVSAGATLPFFLTASKYRPPNKRRRTSKKRQIRMLQN
jgi:hypothetical protein